ncbi:MAG: pilin [Methylococcales bacterium]|jgi:type IV pilus assembly protein PilA|nr:pilin [Methylococcales bacterium]MBT7442907.1 pilin [Methylococcales bacterium]
MLNKNNHRQTHTGFTLIELMIVIAILGAMVSYSVPSFHQYTIKTQVRESYVFGSQLQKAITDYYTKQQRFPKNNQEAGLPPPNKLIGIHVTRIEVNNGSLQLTLGNKVNQKIAGKKLTLQPMVVDGSPKSPISWACGNASNPIGMRKIGNNQTDIPAYYLPIECRI